MLIIHILYSPTIEFNVMCSTGKMRFIESFQI